MIDHLVLCVRDLELARQRFESFGLALTPPASHPFGTRNRLVLLEDNYVELLTIGDRGAIPAPTTDRFSFGAHNQAFLAESEGLSMLALKTTDAHADARAFAARGVETYLPLDFARDATLPDGRTARVAFSVAFATDAALPRLAFFTCQHHQPHRLLGQPDYLRHGNNATRITEVVLSVADPAAHCRFFEALLDTEATQAPGILSFGSAINRITLLARDRLTTRFPECVTDRDAPRFVAYGVSVPELGTVEQRLQAGGIRYRSANGAIVVAPDAAFGAAIEFTRAHERK